METQKRGKCKKELTLDKFKQKCDNTYQKTCSSCLEKAKKK